VRQTDDHSFIQNDYLSPDRKPDEWFDHLKVHVPSVRQVLDAERPFDVVYADASAKLARVSDDINRIERQMDMKEKMIALFDKEIADLHKLIEDRRSYRAL
jgi:hypothetical protein